MKILLGCVFVAAAVQQLLTLIAVKRSSRFLSQDANAKRLPVGHAPCVAIVIPVLREQASIEGALEHFCGLRYPNVRIIVVSTEREGPVESHGSTMEVLRRLSSQYDFTWLHYPSSIGTKADQINYVVDHFPELFTEFDPSQIFIAVYDVDSRPHSRTLECFWSTYQARSSARVFQQSSLFTLNSLEEKRLGYVKRPFLKANAIRATRFVLGYEIPRLRRRLCFYRGDSSLIGRLTYAHCVGHGLFLRLDLLQSLRFPRGSILEDMFYGFLLNCAYEPVIPLPLLDYAEVPSSVTAIFFQMSRWFLGPSRTLSYYHYAQKSHLVREQQEAYALVVSGWWYSARWLFTSPFILSALAICVFNDIVLLKFAAGAFILMYETSVMATISVHNRMLRSTDPDDKKASIRIPELWLIMAMYPAVLIFHSFPAYHCLMDAVFRGGRGSRKLKTERP